MKHIPYKTVSDALAGVAGGDITFSFGNLALGMPLVKGKKLRAIAFSGDARVAEYPEFRWWPSPSRASTSTTGAACWHPLARRRPSSPQLQRDISAVLAQPEVIRSMRRQGLIPLQSTSEEFAKFIKSEQKKNGVGWQKALTSS